MSSTALENLKSLFQDRSEVLKMLDSHELDLSNLSDERLVKEQRKRKIYPEPINLYATGRTRAGKSSLGNSLFDHVFPTTGHSDCTSFIQYFHMKSNLRYYDLPGAGSNEDYENINRAALLLPQLDDPDMDMIPVKEFEVCDFSKSSQKIRIKHIHKGQTEPCVGVPIVVDDKNPSVEHWQSSENQSMVAPDVILYVIAPHEGIGRDDRRYLTALLRTRKERGLQSNIIFALNIHHISDDIMKATPQNIEDAKKFITVAYKKFYSGNPPIVEINALKGTGVNQITKFMCQFLPSNKIGNMQQVLQEELKEYAEKERSRRYRQTLIYIVSRLATYKVDIQLGNQNVLQEAYAAICNYGFMIFYQQEKYQKIMDDLVKNISKEAKVSREEPITILEQKTAPKNITETVVTRIPQYEDKEVEEVQTTYYEDEKSHQETYTHKGDVAAGAILGAVTAALTATVAPFLAPMAVALGIKAGMGGRTRTVTENVMKPAKEVVKRIQKEIIGYEEKKNTIVTGTYQAVVGEREKIVGKKSKQGGYLVIEDLLAIGIGLEKADTSVNFQKNFSNVIESGRLQIQGNLLRYKDYIDNLVEKNDPDKAEQEIIQILEKALLI
ncbi:50S ribosome-binding GTPase [Desulfococcaceae bacterium HSG7]|nr:50S ribosome-binding GTPase [Desulfococcaceae bacterium HSG7]